MGYPQDFFPSYGAAIFEVLAAILTLFSFLGISIALLRKDASMAVAGIVFLCLCLAHSMTVLDMMHYYIKMPFLFIFTACFTSALSRYSFTIPFSQYKFSPVVIPYSLMIGLTILLIAAIQLKLPPHAAPSAITAGKIAAASNIYQSMPFFGPDKAVDNDAATRWATDTSAQQAWLEINLGEPVTFSEVRISELYDRVRRFEIQVRQDDTWKPFISDGRIGCDYRKRFEPVTAQYVRLNILDSAEGPTIGEFQLFKKPGPVTAGSSATASDVFWDSPAFDPNKAVDCNTFPRWAANPQTQQAWLEVDLGKPTTFNQVRIIEKYDRIRRFDLQIKENDKWQTIIPGERIGNDYYAYFIPVTARYVRLNITDSAAAATICELQLFAPDP
jgi:hypothetical protein